MVNQKLSSAPVTIETRNTLRKLAAYYGKPIYVLIGELVIKESEKLKTEISINNS